MRKNKFSIEFFADNAQYFQPIPPNNDFEVFAIGIGNNQSEAYRDAAEMAFSCDEKEADRLPKRKGNKRRGFAHYFGREAAREILSAEESDMHIYCVIFRKK